MRNIYTGCLKTSACGNVNNQRAGKTSAKYINYKFYKNLFSY